MSLERTGAEANKLSQEPRTLLIKVPAAVGYPSYGMNAECRRNFVGNAMLSSGEVTGNPG